MRQDLQNTIPKARQNTAALLSQPVQYRDGTVTFCSLVFCVDARALIPRFETEFLVEETVRWCKTHESRQPWRILDIGTGSGVIAVSLALRLPDCDIMASDISADSLMLAEHNAAMHGVRDRIQFRQGSLLEPSTESPPDIIVANLPYIPSLRIPVLDPEVRDWEPQTALDGGEDGFELYRRLFTQMLRRQLSEKLKLAILEIDNDQNEIAAREIRRCFPEASCQILRDTSGLIRYAKISFRQSLLKKSPKIPGVLEKNTWYPSCRDFSCRI